MASVYCAAIISGVLQRANLPVLVVRVYVVIICSLGYDLVTGAVIFVYFVIWSANDTLSLSVYLQIILP